MEAERWALIERICQAALDRPPGERVAYLEEACAGDEALRREVDSLLACEAEAQSFIEAPPADLAAGLMARQQAQPPAPAAPELEETYATQAAAPELKHTYATQAAALEQKDFYATQAMAEPTPSRQPKPPFFWLVCVLGAALLGYFVFAGVMLHQYGALATDYGWQAKQRGKQWYVTKVDPNGMAVGKLEVGDQLLAINDDPRLARIGLEVYRKAYPEGGPYTVRIARGSDTHQFALQATLRRDSQQLSISISYLLPLGLAFFVVGMLIGLLKPTERTSQLACLAMLSVTTMCLRLSLLEVAQFLPRSERIAWLVLASAWLRAAVAYHFAYRFPASAPSGRFWSLLKYLLYGAGAIFLAFELWAQWRSWPGGEALVSFNFDYLPVISFFSKTGYFWSASNVALLAVVARNYRLVTETDQRRRIKWVIYSGLAVALLNSIPLLSAEIYSATIRTRILLHFAGNMATIVAPLGVGYAILKHRVFDINVVVRRGLQYLLARNSLRIILALPILGLAYSIIANPDRTVREIIFQNPFALALIFIAALSLPFGQRLRLWLDRRFFREAYDQEQILLGLIEEVKELHSMSEVARVVSQKVEAALHPEHLYVFYREEHSRDLRLGYSSGGHARTLSIAESARLLRLMEGQKSAQEYTSLASAGLPADEQAYLAELQIELLVPMNGSDDRLVGLLMLGEKKSEQPYSSTDRRLLFAIAQQMAVVYEIGWLKGRVDKGEQVKREVLARLEGQQVNLLKECPVCGACYDTTEQVCPKEGSELTLTLPVERMIDGKYRLEQLLGRGGMGAVYEATDARLGRRVALKIITGHLFGDRAALRRFEREAQASARLNHRNIITVHDYGAIGTDGAYLVMELLRGSTLRAELKQAGALQPTVAVAYFEQLLEGLKAAHQAGIIHRDLKPENVLLAQQERGGPLLKILDFGLAKLRLLDATDPDSLTAPGMVMGTFGYMSPEQLTGGAVDERSDIFAVGVMVVEALTGSRPFVGRSYGELLGAILQQPFQLVGETPAVQRLNAVLQKCLAKERQQRYGTVAELQAELRPALVECPPFPAPVRRAGESVSVLTS